MRYSPRMVLLAIGLLGCATHALAQSEPQTYEVMINGENFTLEGNRVTRLESQQNPGTVYEVAVRLAPMQRLRLTNLQMLYPLGTAVELDADAPRQSVRLRHELGYTIHLTDLGGTLPEEAVSKAVQLLTDTVVETCQETGATGVARVEAKAATFGESTARGAIVRYQDASGAAQVNLVYVLTGPTYAASCIVQYADADKDDVLSLVRRTLESIQGLASTPAPSPNVPPQPESPPSPPPNTTTSWLPPPLSAHFRCSRSRSAPETLLGIEAGCLLHEAA